MRNIQAHHAVTLFDGECVPEGCRGRLGEPDGTKSTIRWSVVLFAALLFGITTAATAVTVKHISQAPQAGLVGQSLPANMMRAPAMGGFEEAAY